MYLENNVLKTNNQYEINLDNRTHPHITKSFDYGFFWPAGSGGNFLKANTLSSLLGTKFEKGKQKGKNYHWAHYFIDMLVNEYHSKQPFLFLSADEFIKNSLSTEIINSAISDDIHKITKYLDFQFKHNIIQGHWLPVLILSKTNIRIKHLTYVRYSNWVPKSLVHLKRLLKTDLKLTTLSFLLEGTIREIKRNTDKILNHSFSYLAPEYSIIQQQITKNFPWLFKHRPQRLFLFQDYIFWCIKTDFDLYDPVSFQYYVNDLIQNMYNSADDDIVIEKEKQAIEYIKSTNVVDRFEITDYENLFFDLNTELPIAKSVIARYSKRNLIFLNRIVKCLPDNELKIIIMQEFKYYYERIKHAL